MPDLHWLQPSMPERSLRMPQLPSGLTLALSRDEIIADGESWFSCPEGHFWLWVPAPEMGPPPYDLHAEITSMPEHVEVPANRQDVRKFIRVLEMRDDGDYGWRGEWLAEFPKYRDLDAADAAAWAEWLGRPEIETFLDETIAHCLRMAEAARTAVGDVVGAVDEPLPPEADRADRWVKMRFWDRVPWRKRRGS